MEGHAQKWVARRPDTEQTFWSRTRCSLNIASNPPRSNWRASTSPLPLRWSEAHALEPLRCAWCGRRDRTRAQILSCWPPLESPRRSQQSDAFARWWHPGSEDEDGPFWDTSIARMKTENNVATEDGAKVLNGPTCEASHHHQRVAPKQHWVGEAHISWVDAEARVALLADTSILEPNSAACTIRPAHRRRACILMQAVTERVAMRQSTRFFHYLFSDSFFEIHHVKNMNFLNFLEKSFQVLARSPSLVISPCLGKVVLLSSSQKSCFIISFLLFFEILHS